MVQNKIEQQSAERQRSPRLSPELSEFLHMLEALENQLSAPQLPALRSRAA